MRAGVVVLPQMKFRGAQEVFASVLPTCQVEARTPIWLAGEMKGQGTRAAPGTRLERLVSFAEAPRCASTTRRLAGRSLLWPVRMGEKRAGSPDGLAERIFLFEEPGRTDERREYWYRDEEGGYGREMRHSSHSTRLPGAPLTMPAKQGGTADGEYKDAACLRDDVHGRTSAGYKTDSMLSPGLPCTTVISEVTTSPTAHRIIGSKKHTRRRKVPSGTAMIPGPPTPAARCLRIPLLQDCSLLLATTASTPPPPTNNHLTTVTPSAARCTTLLHPPALTSFRHLRASRSTACNLDPTHLLLVSFPLRHFHTCPLRRPSRPHSCKHLTSVSPFIVCLIRLHPSITQLPTVTYKGDVDQFHLPCCLCPLHTCARLVTPYAPSSAHQSRFCWSASLVALSRLTHSLLQPINSIQDL
ncbi:hypothetical protein Q7P37_010949 [Cladosporium fusiforme]